jgi:hypothetical protein
VRSLHADAITGPRRSVLVWLRMVSVGPAAAARGCWPGLAPDVVRPDLALDMRVGVVPLGPREPLLVVAAGTGPTALVVGLGVAIVTIWLTCDDDDA